VQKLDPLFYFKAKVFLSVADKIYITTIGWTLMKFLSTHCNAWINSLCTPQKKEGLPPYYWLTVFVGTAALMVAISLMSHFMV